MDTMPRLDRVDKCSQIKVKRCLREGSVSLEMQFQIFEHEDETMSTASAPASHQSPGVPRCSASEDL